MNEKNPTKKEWGINLNDVKCPKCKAVMPAIRVSENLHQLMWGGWSCPNCQCKMDKWGKEAKNEGLRA